MSLEDSVNNNSMKAIEAQLADALDLLSEICEQLAQYVNTRLTVKQHESLRLGMINLQAVLTGVQNRLLRIAQEQQLLENSATSNGCGGNVQRPIPRPRSAVTAHDSADDTRFSTLTSGIDSSSDGIYFDRDHENGRIDEVLRLRADNSRLYDEAQELQLELRLTKDQLLEASFNTPSGRGSTTSLDFVQKSQELARCKETLKAMKADRKRLKSENYDLHIQMKQLYCTLGDKEAELRDFIRGYDQRKQESHEAIKQLTEDKLQSDEEICALQKKVEETTALNQQLQSQLQTQEAAVQRLQQQLLKLLPPPPRRPPAPPKRTTPVNSAGLPSRAKSCFVSEDCIPKLNTSASCSTMSVDLGGEATSSGGRVVNLRRGAGSLNMDDNGGGRSVGGGMYASCGGVATGVGDDDILPPYQEMFPPAPSPVVEENRPLSQLTQLSRAASMSEGQLQANRKKVARMAEHQSRYENLSASGQIMRDRGRSPGSQILATNGVKEKRNSLVLTPRSPSIAEFELPPPPPSPSPSPLKPAMSRLSLLTQDNYQKKMATMAEAHAMEVSRWRAHHVLAWIEIDMNMVAYGPACSDNIKSGKILLGLSDAELESSLRLSSRLHRRKVRLAIEELRDPSSIRYPAAGAIDHMWVSHEWIYSLGLPQYSAAFETQLVDGRLLDVISKKDLDKHVGVHNKFHQASISYGIELLRLIDFDKQVLHERRCRSKQSADDDDLLVWSNQQIIQWAERVDLQEYSENLRESGIHGAVLVLDTNFNAESLATILGLSTSKSYVRRHLTTELDSIVRPARVALEEFHAARRNASKFKRSFTGSVAKSDSAQSPTTISATKRLSLRGSIGRAFSRRTSNEATLPPSGSKEQARRSLNLGSSRPPANSTEI